MAKRNPSQFLSNDEARQRGRKPFAARRRTEFYPELDRSTNLSLFSEDDDDENEYDEWDNEDAYEELRYSFSKEVERLHRGSDGGARTS